MAVNTAELREKAGDLAGRLAEWAKLHRFWFESAGVTLLALLVLAAVGAIALRRAADWQAQAQRLRAIETAAAELIIEFEPADSVETAAWQESEQQLRQLMFAPMDPLGVASLVANRAEEVGLPGTRVSLITNDTENVPGDFAFGAWNARGEPTTILVDVVADLSGAARLVGSLPPNVEVASVRVQPADGAYRSQIRLVARTVIGPP